MLTDLYYCLFLLQKYDQELPPYLIPRFMRDKVIHLIHNHVFSSHSFLENIHHHKLPGIVAEVKNFIQCFPMCPRTLLQKLALCTQYIPKAVQLQKAMSSQLSKLPMPMGMNGPSNHRRC